MNGVRRRSPVSQAIEHEATGKVAAAIKITLAAVDLVHDDGDLPKLKIEVAPGLKKTHGLYTPRIGLRDEMKVNPAANVAFTVLHEIAHFLDRRALDDYAPGFASENSRCLDRFWKVALKKKRKQDLEAIERAYRGDVSSRKEVFARGYCQYIATKSGDGTLLAGLEDERAALFGRILYWSDEEFCVILTAIDRLFEEKGWL